MKSITFIKNTENWNDSDVLGIIIRVTEEGLARLRALQERAADFTYNWADSSVNSIKFELPEGVQVAGINSSLEDETELEFGDKSIPFRNTYISLSDNDDAEIKNKSISSTRLIDTDTQLSAEDFDGLTAALEPEWALCPFQIIFWGDNPAFEGSFENTDGGESTGEIDLSRLTELMQR